MKLLRSSRGFTLLEMVWAVLVVAGLSSVYFFLLDSYQERRMSEQAAKVLMLAAHEPRKSFSLGSITISMPRSREIMGKPT